MRKLFAFVFLLMLAGSARAQFVGYVSQQTTTQAVFTSQASTTTSATFTNIGQGAHYLSFCVGATFSGTIDLEESADGATNWIPLAVGNYNSANVAGCHVLQAGGYYNALRSHVFVAAGSISAWYTGVAAPIHSVPTGIGTVGPMPPVVCDKAISVVVNSATTGNVIQPSNATDAIYICGFTISFAAAPAAGSFALGWASSGACTGVGNTWAIVTTTLTPQILIVPIPQVSLQTLVGANQFMCVTNASGQNATVNVSFASIHVL